MFAQKTSQAETDNWNAGRAVDDDPSEASMLSRAGADRSANDANDFLTAANVWGVDRQNLLKDVKEGYLTLEQLQSAYPNVELPA